MSENQATYSPEDNKLRLYVGRVPRDEYEKLRADGWTSTPKQSCDFVATWSPTRRDTCLDYAGVILDEDQGPEDRAADRAERFSGYREKRTEEATGHADTYDAGPHVHGFQSQARAERSARRHDQQAGYAVDAWSKAEYWQRRTAGVISHALYKSRPDVRMGRIKVLEAELRKAQADIGKRTTTFKAWQHVAQMEDAQKQAEAARYLADYAHSDYKNPITGETQGLYRIAETPGVTGSQVAALWLAETSEPAQENDWTRHLTLRLAYENQMLEAQGGRAAHVEMVPGGFFCGHQIHKVNKSSVTGRVVSVLVKGPKCEGWTYKAANVPGTDYALYQHDTERAPANAYRPPTAEELAAFEAERETIKAARPKADPCPLINPTEADAIKLQAIWNEKHPDSKPAEVRLMTQEQYSAAAKGGYSGFETVAINEFGTEFWTPLHGVKRHRCQVFKVRKSSGGNFSGADRIVVLTDKPQKAIPFDAIAQACAAQPTAEKMRLKLAEIHAELSKDWSDASRNHALLEDAAYVGWVQIHSTTQIYATDKGAEEMRAAGVYSEAKA